jgi:UDP-glucose 4-epimerase
MKVSIVTGCAGFIGSHMVDYLIKKKHKVIGIDNFHSGGEINIRHNFKNEQFQFIKDDVENFNKIIKKIKKIDYIFHFAGSGELIPSIENPYFYFKNNTINSTLLIDSLRKRKIKKLIYAASSTCYGLANKKSSENQKIDLQHPYAFSKYQGEQSILHWSKIYKIPSISIRIFNAYGPRSRTSGAYGAVIGVFLKQKLSEYPLTIVGSGNQKRDFLYVSDVCDAFFKAAISKYKNEIFNLGYGKSKKVNFLANLISKKKIHIKWRNGEPKITEANINKIKEKLGWRPKIKLKDGIKIVLNNIYYWDQATLWTKEKIYRATKNWNKLLK